ncbi:hypothetical protein E1B28_013590 [Marasmius oreades]|uniref:Uncharacterized protein n=1 Tax=Marasmius oreades TaxID=181124 RepID=A0A9P7RQ50_9AGAR|nr:uncharacterized protein E1B28_013590 [Marasmius oreades]KAG7087642.1 hypothetical protein E1B28_013590 [Marasmius oreades]
MKFFTLALAALLPVAALAQEPTFYLGKSSATDTEPALEKRTNSGVVRTDGLRYRTCPRTSCTAIGQYAINTRVQLVCYTRTDTTVVNGDAGWAKLTNGYWVALASGTYVSWSGSLPHC